MNNKLSFFLGFLFLLPSLSAQEFAPVGATWYIPTVEFAGWGMISVFESVGDTIIQDKSCRIVNKNQWTCYGDEGAYYIHQQNDSVFLYNIETENFDLIIDFGAEEGDEWVVPTPAFLIDYEYFDSLFIRVDSISYMQVDTLNLRVQYVYVSTEEWNPDVYHSPPHTKIVEKFGFWNTLFPPNSLPTCDFEREIGIRCYQDNEVGLLKFEEVDCLVAVEDYSFKDKVEIFPNPASGIISVTSDGLKVETLKLFSLAGNVMLSTDSYYVDVSRVPNGLYYLWVSTEKGDFYEKVVVNH